MKKISELFGADLRSLALFRIGLGVLILIDLAIRLTDLKAHYTDFGVLPRYALIEKFSGPWNVSLHLMNGSVWFQATLFLAAALFAVLLVIGYRTRLATIASWILMASLHVRNPMVCQGGDDVFRMLLFWSMFLPLGARFSIDHRLDPSPEKTPERVLSMGTVALFAQIVIVYLFNTLNKSGMEWRMEGTAVYYALSIDQYATPIGQALLNFPALLVFLTKAVFWFEFIGPFLLFIPVFTGPIRTLIVFVFALMHLGFWLCLEIGLFPWIDIVAVLVFLPSWFWEKIFSPIAKLFERFKQIKLPVFLARRPVKLTLSLPTSLLAAFFLGYVLLWNLEGLSATQRWTDPFFGGDHGKFKIPASLKWLGHLAVLDQKWNMFAPYPLKDDGWYVIPGKLKDGSEIDLFKNGGSVRWEKPAQVYKIYKNYRWQKYMMNLWLKKFEAYRLYYGQYLCRDWNSKHQGEKQLDSFQIYFMLEQTPPPGGSPTVEKVLLWNHWCFGAPPPVPVGPSGKDKQAPLWPS